MNMPANVRSKARALLLGQVLSILIALTGVFTTYLQDAGVQLPTAQSFLVYALLSGYLVVFWWRSKGHDSALQRDDPVSAGASENYDCGESGAIAPGAQSRQQGSWWQYALCALADVEGNFLVVKAYQYTTITSVTLLDCFSIPCCMALSFLVLGRRFTGGHIGGVLFCLGGLGLLVYSDVTHPPSPRDPGAKAPSNPVVGDMLCVAGTVLYACSNVSQEFYVRRDRVYFLGMLGAFGTLVSGVQMAILEGAQIVATDWTSEKVGYLCGFVASLFLMYTLTSLFLAQEGDAVLFNLSLLTSDVWAVVAGTMLFSETISPLYFGAFAVVGVGTVLYVCRPPTDTGTAPIAACWSCTAGAGKRYAALENGLQEDDAATNAKERTRTVQE